MVNGITASPPDIYNGQFILARFLNGTLRLAAKRHESAEPVNLTWTEYQWIPALDQVRGRNLSQEWRGRNGNGVSPGAKFPGRWQ